MPTTRLERHLDQHQIPYASLQHSPAYSAQQLAHALHFHGWELAKTVIVIADGEPLMAVLAAPESVDLGRLSAVIGAGTARLAHEDELRRLFPDCEVGAMPPFGSLWEIPVYIDDDLAGSDVITFRAGSHREAIRMQMDDYLDLEQPEMASFAVLTTGVQAPVDAP
jgi:Ala-tRNA(Pro) deacylase